MNEDQKKAFEVLMSGKNVFLTGDAGTGKTYLINKFIEEMKKQKKNLVITAPTGIAALNIGGVTIHSAFGIPVGKDLTKVFISPNDVIQTADIIIIDEISMCRMDLFDVIGAIIKAVDKKIQVVVIGDFYQLPPVLNEKDKKILNEYYKYDVGGAFAFESEYWKDFDFESIVLKEVVRQDNPRFITALNYLRKGNPISLKYFVGHCSKEPIKDAITIVGTNKRAEQINELQLSKIRTLEYTFIAQKYGEINVMPTSDILKLKLGARVMTLINASMYRNGSVGTIVGINDNEIKVKFDDDTYSYIQKYTWEFKEYVAEDGVIKEKIVGRFNQLPVKLAYAITVHKSQGQTYEAVNFEPCGWSHGQLYVALSRCKDISKLYIAPGLRYSHLICVLGTKEGEEII